MNIRIVYLFLAFALFFATDAFSQVDRRIGREQYKRGKREKVDFVEQSVDYYKKELKLDDFQAAAMKEIFEGERDNINSLNQSQGLTKNEIKDKAQGIYDRIDNKIMPLLSDDQQKKYKELRKISDDKEADLEKE
ncbi:MAG: hypothetical protein V4581_00720 [Bacteroidota bacterium]